jgi:(p)ppGpp synthase/HD superfamily hydrolase
MLKDAGLDEDVVVAGYLHDAVEDTEMSLQEIERTFGKNVGRIVAGNTEDKTKSWTERKAHTVDYVCRAPFNVKALIVADKLDNLQSLGKAHVNQGEAIWDKFNGTKEAQKWYYTSIAANAFVGIEDNVEVPEYFYTYRNLVADFFENV